MGHPGMGEKVKHVSSDVGGWVYMMGLHGYVPMIASVPSMQYKQWYQLIAR